MSGIWSRDRGRALFAVQECPPSSCPRSEADQRLDQSRGPRGGLAGAIAIVCITATSAAQIKDHVLLQEFTNRVADYVTLRRHIELRVPPPRVSADGDEIQSGIDAVAAAIRAARPHAKPGEFFGPELGQLFRRRIQDALTRHGLHAADLLADMNNETPRTHVELRVNGPFDWAYAAQMPAVILEVLPALPGELQYRFVNRDLVLLDIRAELIVDVLPHALGGEFNA